MPKAEVRQCFKKRTAIADGRAFLVPIRKKINFDLDLHYPILKALGILPIIIGIDDEDLLFFTNNMKKYLEEICDIYA